MRHLSDETLSAHLDRALTGRAAEEAERHLATCETCRTALAGLAAQDEALRPALTHDPGEAYFEQFSSRVEARIRGSLAAGARSRGTGFDLGRWFGSPRTLAWVGAAATVVVGVGIALMSGREVRPPDLRDRDGAVRVEQAPPREMKDVSGQTIGPPAAQEEWKPGEPGEPGEPGARVVPVPLRSSAPEAAVADDQEVAALDKQDATMSKSVGTRERADELAAPPPPVPPAQPAFRDAREASPGRAFEVRRNESGEDVPVRKAAPFAAPPPPSAPAGPEAETQIRKKRLAQPLATSKTSASARSLDAGATMSESAKGEYSAITPPTGTANTATGRLLGMPRSAEGEVRLCGEVRDASGRPVAGAQVVVADLGRATTSDARGGFCVGVSGGEHTLSVMAVGFTESRRTVRVGADQTPLRVTLEVVPVLEDKRASLAGRTPLPRMTAPPPAERQDQYSVLPDTLRSMVRAAQDLEASARARRSAGLYDAAAAGWERALGRLAGGPLELETRRHLAEARFLAWETGPNGRRTSAAMEALTAYALRAPAGAEREQAMGWLERVRR